MRFLYLILLLIGSPALAQLNADFSASVTQGCTNLTVSFKDQSSGSPTSWFWDFGNGQTSSLQNPVITYDIAGNYSVRLIVRNASEDDFEYKAGYISVYATPVIYFRTVAGDSGCVALKSSFKDSTNFFNAPAKSWLWNFGDGSTSSQQNPTHTFNGTGKYDVSLTVQTTQGCSASLTKYSAVRAGTKPTANFSASPLTGCASVFRNFINKSSGSVTASVWDFGDGGFSNEKNPLYHYKDTGKFSVKLAVFNNGCKDSVRFPDYIHVDGPVAAFRTVFNCANRYVISFYDESIAEASRLWDFGDGTTSTLSNLTHTYSSPGVYYVKLIITGSTCNDTALDTIRIKTTTPALQISPTKPFYCKYDTLIFTTTNYDTADVKFFYWDFGDNVRRSGYVNTVTHVYDSAAKFKPIGYIRGLEGCTDTINIKNNIIINGPSAGFSVDTSGCTNSAIHFSDTSSAAGSSITKWLWGFGDGITSTSKGSFTHIYNFPGTYNSNLKITDANGCSDSIAQTINIDSTPVVNASANASFACAGNTVQLKATGADNYVWQNTPDLSCINCANPIAKPQQATTYFVKGTSNGCSATDSVHLFVQTKELISVESNKYAICAGGNSVMLIAHGTDSYLWSPSNTLSSTIIQNPVAFPSVNTTYTVIGKDSLNCFTDTATVDVAVNEKPSVNITDSIVHVMTGFNYTILGSVSNDVQSYEWVPPTGLSCTNCLQPIVNVTNTAEYTLAGTNSFGCTDSAHITIVAVCSGDAIFIPNTFSPNNDGMNDYFFPRSSTSITIKSFSIFNRWGQLVFQKQNFSSNNSSNGWDGKFKNQLQNADVYVYVMELECSGNKVFIKKGNVSLVR